MSTIHINGYFSRYFFQFSTMTIVLCLLLILPACQSNELTAEEIAIQNAADAQMSAALFDYDLDNHASYNVHPDGSVIIRFDRSVTMNDYTSIVDALRAMPEINDVYATQGGIQVCPLTSIQK